MLQAYLAGRVVLKVHTLWAHYQMCTLCTVIAPGTSNCSAAKMGKTNKPESCGHPASLRHSHCKYSLIYTHSALPLHSLYAVFPACSFLLTNLLDILGYLDYIIISFSKTYILFISKHILIMVLPVKNGNISLSCTIYSQLSVQHAHKPQALASCVYKYIYLQAAYLICYPPYARRVLSIFVFFLCSQPNIISKNIVRRNWIKQNSLYRHALKLLDLHYPQIQSEQSWVQHHLEIILSQLMLSFNLFGIADKRSFLSKRSNCLRWQFCYCPIE